MSNIIEITEEAGLVRPMERHDQAVVAGLMARARARDPLAPDPAILAEPGLSAFVAERFGYVVGYALVGQEIAQRYVMEGSRGLGLGAKLDVAAQNARVMPTSTLIRW